jgi:NADP-dependent 3-hydroxy acid dehydrogenase YdfG
MIIGGTSGIGLALAEHYLALGDQVAICGRDLQRLDPQIVNRYPAVSLYQLDIADKAALSTAIDDFSSAGLDLLIVTAGLYFNTPVVQLEPMTVLRMLQTNVSGLNHAFELASRKMLPQKSGQLVAIASIAGLLRDYPGASLYSATKRMVIALCDTYRKALTPFSIAVTVIVPGYIDTAKLRALNHGDASHKPYLITEHQAVKHIVKAIAQRQARCVFPWQMHWLVNVFNYLPSPLRRILRK